MAFKDKIQKFIGDDEVVETEVQSNPFEIKEDGVK